MPSSGERDERCGVDLLRPVVLADAEHVQSDALGANRLVDHQADGVGIADGVPAGVSRQVAERVQAEFD